MLSQFRARLTSFLKAVVDEEIVREGEGERGREREERGRERERGKGRGGEREREMTTTTATRMRKATIGEEIGDLWRHRV